MMLLLVTWNLVVKQIWGDSAEVYTLPKRYWKKGAGKNNEAPQSFPASELPCQGPFYTKSVGISMGGGQEEPKPFSHGILNTLILVQLLATEPFRRIAGFVNTKSAQTTIESLYAYLLNLPRNYDKFTSVFAAATFDFVAQSLIPSAILRHSNVSIQQGETRYSFTQYAAAGIFCYVADSFCTEKQVNLSEG
ncbi:hypothetical protein B0H13DRAFT_1888148 [Mycena leptocephala]|nr:hypothetical protein B0H13DRAFT_1888148 [Mycena leptocephala]